MAYPIKFGKYLLLERINVGGMAEVFRAKAFGVQGFERLLAIKRILPNMAEDDDFISMFVDEARIAVQLSHSNVVQVYELGKFEGQYYIAMEYVLGRDLRQIFDRFRKSEKSFPISAAAFVASKICDGLDYAHRKCDPSGGPLNLIHRDVSPQNILVSYDGAIRITDFGIAKAEDRSSKTQAGVLKGKFGYMSPEQVRGMEIDRRSDIFALGILLYEMVTGERLFIGESDFSTLEKVRAAEVPPPTTFNAEIPEELEKIMLKALARDRDERYEWASDLHDDLQRFLIVDNTIYNEKALAGMLREEYAEEILTEKRKAEEFMRLSAKEMQMEPESSGSVSASPESPPSPALSSLPMTSGTDGDKTMIFESYADFASDETMIGAISSELIPQNDAEPVATEERHDTATEELLEQPPSDETMDRSEKSGGDNVGRMILAGTVLLCALVIGAVWFLIPQPRAVGEILVTSSPTQTVDVFLDGGLIGKRTPINRSDVALGEHTISAKAEGFVEKVYRFHLAAGQPARIEFKLEPSTEAAPEVMTDGAIQVVTEPSGALVRANGVSRGETPLTISGLDRKRGVLLEVSKSGYDTQKLTVNFDEEGTKKEIELVLKASVKKEAPAPTLSPKPVPKPTPKPRTRSVAGSDQPTRRYGFLAVDSNPSGATVYMEGKALGVTPLTHRGLEKGELVVVEVRKEGYRDYRAQVSWFEGTGVRLVASLKSTKAVARQEKTTGKAAPSVVAKPKPKSRPGPPVSADTCAGVGGKLSVMPVGVPNCRVKIGNLDLGVAPIFKKAAPVGKCTIEVTCSDGRSYKVTKKLSAGSAEKVIIKPGDW
ncbi:MAG: serine/threonine-protein kinase [Myxococcota bacterium]|nr:serine/threonine-protein kinase [Myxococcota bacterium]